MMQSDRQIRYLAKQHAMISPFSEKLLGKAENVLSWGPSSYGYDIRLGTQFKEVADPDDVLDPKTITEKQYRAFTSKKPVILEPNRFLLGCSVERFKLPRNVVAIPFNKSTYARCGINASLTTIAEPAWEGILTIEIANHGSNPVRIYPGEGIIQLIFLKGADECETSYADRAGKYQSQEGVTIPKVSQLQAAE